MAERTIKAGEFKAKCLSLLDEVAANGEAIIITKRGRPVARVIPAAPPQPKTSPIGFMKGLLDLADPKDVLLSAWDDEINSAFEDGLETTAHLIERDAPTAKPKSKPRTKSLR
jgi:prevent-host-death family protein